MNSNIESLVEALKVITEENVDSKAIPIIESALKKAMKDHLMDMAVMERFVNLEELKEDYQSVMKIIEFADSSK